MKALWKKWALKNGQVLSRKKGDRRHPDKGNRNEWKARKQEFNTDLGLPQSGMGLGSKDTKICEVQFFALNQPWA